MAKFQDSRSNLRGFRRRWGAAFASASDDGDGVALEEQEPSLGDFDLIDEPHSSDTTLEEDRQASSPFSFVLPAAKASAHRSVRDFIDYAQTPASSSDLNASVKRTADELALNLVSTRIAGMKQPWEVGPLAGIFGKTKPFWNVAPGASGACIGLSDHLMASSSSSPPQPRPYSEATIQRVTRSRVIQSEDDFRRIALSRFKTMVMVDVAATKLGQSLVSFAGTVCTDAELTQSFSDVFAAKSSGTLLKRSNALWRYHCWIQKTGRGSPFCQNESTVYRYICFLRESASPTTPSQLVESLRFADSLLTFVHTPLAEQLSPRVVGASHAAFMTKRVRKPAELLTVKEIQHLEWICLNDADEKRRLIAGNLLFCFLSACKWADSHFIVSMDFSSVGDLHLVEAATERHKTSRSKQQQRELLPFTALGNLFDVRPWSESWKEAREATGTHKSQHFIRSWSDARGDWADVNMSTAEATLFLREFVEETSGPDRAACVTVHGLKGTILSWAAKACCLQQTSSWPLVTIPIPSTDLPWSILVITKLGCAESCRL